MQMAGDAGRQALRGERQRRQKRPAEADVRAPRRWPVRVLPSPSFGASRIQRLEDQSAQDEHVQRSLNHLRLYG